MATSTIFFTDGEDVVSNGVSETINNATGSPLNTSFTLADGSVVQVQGGSYLIDTLGGSVQTVTDNSSHNDVINGNSGGDTFTLAGSGNYTLNGGIGNDTVFANGAGNYAIDEGNGNDTISATGDGNYIITDGNGSDTIDATGPGNYTVTAGNGNDLVDASGSTGSVALKVGTGRDIVKAGLGHDSVSGGAGGDLLYSGTGAGETDFLFSTAGASPYLPTTTAAPAWVSGSWGGGWDVIVGFKHGVDKINLAALALTGPGAGGELLWAGQPYAGSSNGDAASGNANPALAYAVWTATDASGVIYVYANTDGSGTADLKIQISVASTFTSVDFAGVGILLTPQLADDSGISATDKITSNDAIIGLSGDGGAAIILKVDNTTTATVTAAANGSWSYTPTLADGIHTIAASETDAAGNTGTATLAFTLDTGAGEAATLSIGKTLIGSAGAGAVTFGITGFDAEDTGGAGNTGAVSVVEGGQTVTVGVTGDGTYAANLSALPDGTVSDALSFTDVAGNTFSATGNAVTLDQDLGGTASVSGPTGTLGSAGAAAVKFVVSGNLDDETGSLTLSDGTFHSVLAVSGPGTYTADLANWGNGAVTAGLAVSDLAGNSFTASTTVAIDPDLGAVASLTGPAGTRGSAGAAALAFTVGTPDASGDTGSLTLTDGKSHTVLAVNGAGTYTASLATWPDGVVNASLAISDPAGNSFGATTKVVIDPDYGESVTLKPALTLIGSAGAGAVRFVVSGNLDDETGSLSLADDTASSAEAYTGDGTYAFNLAGANWADGAVSSTLSVSDAAGNSFAASGAAVTLDKDAGDTVGLAPFATLIGSAGAGAVRFVVSGNLDDETGSLSLGDGTASSAEAYTGDGTYAFNLAGANWADGAVSSTLSVSDAAGNSFAASGAAVTLDKDAGDAVTLAPALTLIGSAGAGAVRFVVSGNLDDETGSLSLGDGTASSAEAYTGDGTYAFNLAGANWADGAVSSTLSVSDAAGNSFAASGAAVTLDKDAGDTVGLAPFATLIGSAGAGAVRFVVSGNLDDETGSLSLGDGTASSAEAYTGDGTYAFNLAGANWADGAVTSTLSVSDAAGNSFAASGAAVTLDKDAGDTVGLAPFATLIGSAGAGAVRFVVSGNLDDETGSLTLGDGAASSAEAYTGDGTYAFNLAGAGWADGAVTSTLSVSDAAGNSFAASGAAVTLDKDAGDAVTLAPALTLIGSAGAGAVRFVVSGNLDGETGSLTLSDAAASSAEAYTGDGTYAFNLAGANWADGAVTSTLSVSDAAGNSFAASGAAVTLDKDAGDTVGLAPFATLIGSAGAGAVRFVVSGNLDDETGSLSLGDGTASSAEAYTGDGTYAFNLAGANWADGAVSSTLSVSDAAGNSFAASGAAVTLDKDAGDTVGLAPFATLIGSAGAGAVRFVVSGNLDDETGSLSLGDGTASSAEAYTGDGTYAFNLAGANWADGAVTSTLSVSDAAGNSFAASGAAVTLDKDAGDTVGLAPFATLIGSAGAGAVRFVVSGNLDDETGSLSLSDGAASSAEAYTGDGTYAFNLAGANWADGAVTSTLSVSDAAGNSFAASGAAVTLDKDAGDTVGLAPFATLIGSAGAGAVRFVVSGNLDDETGSLSLGDGTASTALAYTGDGTYAFNLAGANWADGAVTSTLSVSDAAGNSFAASGAAVTLDKDAGDTVGLAPFATLIGSAGAGAVRFVVSGNLDGETGSLSLSDGTASSAEAYTGDGTYAFNLAGANWADGAVTSTLSVSDAAGNSFAASGAAVTLDKDAGDAVTLAPALTLIGSAGAGAVRFVVSGNLDDETGSLTLGDGTASSAEAYTGDGTYAFNLAGANWADGAVSSTLSVSDAAGNSFAASGAAVTLDKDAGDTVGLAPFATLIGSAGAGAVRFVVSGNLDDETGSLSLGDGTASSAEAYTGDGTYAFNLAGANWADGAVSSTLSVSDAAGNSFAASGAAVTLDKDAGDTVGLAPFATLIGSAGAGAVRFVVSGNLDDETGSLSLGDGTASSAEAYTGDGTYAFNLAGANWADGAVSSTLSVSDAAGNSFAASGAAVTLDKDAGDTVGLAPFATLIGSAGAGAVRFVVSGNLDDETGSLTLGDGAASSAEAYTGDGTYAFNLAGANWADGAVTSTLSVSDAAGNSFAASGAAVTLDKDAGDTVGLAPFATLIGSAGAGAVRFVVSGNLDDETGSLSLGDGTASSAEAYTGDGTYAFNLAGAGWADGAVTSTLSVSDAAGNSFAASGTAVTLDKDAGDTVGLAPAGTLIGSAGAGAVRFVVSGNLDDETGSLSLSDGTASSAEAYTGDGTYAFNLAGAGWADGAVSSTLSVSDAAGNSFAASGAAVTLDKDAGDTVGLAPFATLIGSAGAGAVRFVVSGNLDDETGSLTLSDGTASTALAYTGDGTYAFNLAGANWADGAVTSTLSVSDAAGNSFAASGAAVTLDKDAGDTVGLAPFATLIGSAGAGAVRFVVSGNLDDETGSLTLADGAASSAEAYTGDGTYAFNLAGAGWADGAVSSTLSVSDAAGNSFAASGAAVTLDKDAGDAVTLAPAGTLIGSAGAGAVRFVVSGNLDGETGSLSLSDGTASTALAYTGDGTYAFNLAGANWADGAVTSTLSVSDAAGNSFAASGAAVTLDKDAGDAVTLAPALTLIGSAGAGAVRFVVSGNLDDETGSLSLGDGTASSAEAYTGDGTYAFNLAGANWADGAVSSTLSVSDAAGNSFAASGAAVTLDKDAGDTVGLAPFATLIGSAGAGAVRFVVSGNLDGETGSLTLSDAAASSAEAYTGDGTYAFNLAGANWADGAVSSTLSVSDAAGNSFAASGAAVTLDKDAGDAVTLAPAGTLIGSAGAGAVRFVVSGNLDDETGSLSLSDGTASSAEAYTGDGTYAFNLAGANWADGAVTSTLSVSDAAGNSFAASGAAVTLDKDAGDAVTLAPAGTLIGSAGAGAVRFVVSGNLDDETGSLSLSDGTASSAEAYTGDGTYAFNLAGANWADGAVTSTLSVSDAAGNSFAASGTAVTLDKDAGDTVGLAPAGTLIGSAGAGAVRFVVSGNLDDETGSLTLSDAAASSAEAYTGDGTYAFNLAGANWADGAVTSTLSVSDAAGNSFAASGAAVTLDKDAGDAVTLAPAGTLIGSAGGGAVRFVVSGNLDDETGSLSLSDGTASSAEAYTGDGTYAFNLAGAGWADGAVTSTLSVSDAAGNSFAASGAAVTLDKDAGDAVTLAPALTLIGSAGAGAVRFVVSGNLDGETGSLTLSDAAASSAEAYTGDGTYAFNLAGANWADGAVTSTLSVSDAAGNSFAASGAAVTLDKDAGDAVTLAPALTLIGSAGAGAVRFVVSGNLDDETGSLTLGDGTASSAEAYTGDGTYAFNLAGANWADGAVSSTLSVSDAAGNSFAASGAAVTLDKDAGDTVGLAPFATLIGSAGAGAVRFVVSGNLDDETGSLSLGDGTASSAEAYTGDGTYAFNLAGANWADGAVSSTLSVSDAAGNSFAASGAAVTLDKDAGDTATLTIGDPTETVGSATATFTISGLADDTGGAGDTGTVSFVEGTQTVTVGVTGDGTYTATLSALVSAGTVTTSLTFTDPAGNSFPATGSNVTLLANGPPTLSSIVANDDNEKVVGDVEDPNIGTITISAFDKGGGRGSTGTIGTTTVSETASNENVSFTISEATHGHSFSIGDTLIVTAWEAGGSTATVTLLATSPAGAAGSPINLALTDPSGVAGESVAVTVTGVPAGWSLNAGADLGNGSWAEQGSDLASLAVTPPAGFAGAVVLGVSESWTNPDGSSGGEFVSDNVEAYAPGAPIFALANNDTLVGAGGDDLFVFAHPIGNDTIDNFNSASDRIDLVGFPNIGSFADVRTQLTEDANGDAVIALGNGEAITITGVEASALSASNFLFNTEPMTTNAGTMTIADGAILPLGGTIDNTGTIALNSAGKGAELEIQVGGVTLEGGGQIALSDDGRNIVSAGDPSAVLTNIDNTIAGAGQFGGGTLTLDNAGFIDATGANALVIDTGANTIANSGTLEASGSGGLVIDSALANSGTLWADGGNVTVGGAASGGGIARISGGATLEFAAASDAQAGFAAGASGTLMLDQPGLFSGTVAGLGAGDRIDFADIAFSSNDTLGYAANAAGTGGTLTVSDHTHTANLALLGQYAAAGFATAADAGGGTVVTYAPAEGSTETLLTNPHR